jgi:hypothetical protein
VPRSGDGDVGEPPLLLFVAGRDGVPEYGLLLQELLSGRDGVPAQFRQFVGVAAELLG